MTIKTALIQRLASKKNKKQNGFTMIELMVVVAIVGVLTAVGLPSLTAAQNKAKDSAAKAEVVNAAKTCAVDLIAGTSSYDANDFPLTTGSCALEGDIVATSSTGTTYTVTMSDTGEPSAPVEG